MSLTSAIAMTRENACTERSTESNQPHRPIVSSPPNASAEFESSTRSGGALCWERANGESVTPVVSPTSVDCPGPAIVTTTSKVAKSISQYSVSTSVLAGAQSPDAGSRSEEIQVSFHACFACFRAILTRFPHIAFSATLPRKVLCGNHLGQLMHQQIRAAATRLNAYTGRHGRKCTHSQCQNKKETSKHAVVECKC